MCTLTELHSDIDLVVHTRHAIGLEERKRSLYQIKSRLQSAGVIFEQDAHVITRAKVPVVSFKVVSELGLFSHLHTITRTLMRVFPRWLLCRPECQLG
jgi:DNA polymerase sigma